MSAIFPTKDRALAMMLPRFAIPAVAVLALGVTTPPAAAQEAAPATGSPADAATASGLDQVMEALAPLFESEPLTPQEAARLPAATAVVSTMLPEGFYAEMMGETMDSMIGPMMGVMSGELAAEAVISRRVLDADAVLENLSAEQTIELATILDPAFGQRGAVMESLLGDIMRQAAVTVEPLFRDGMARAYAVRFDEEQLADIAAFFATPTGAVFAPETMKMMADPQVMSASMQALPAMFGQLGDMEARLAQAFADLPEERSYAELSPAERERLGALTGMAPGKLEAAILPPDGGDTGDDGVALDDGDGM